MALSANKMLSKVLHLGYPVTSGVYYGLLVIYIYHRNKSKLSIIKINLVVCLVMNPSKISECKFIADKSL